MLSRRIKEWQAYGALSLVCLICITVQFRVFKGSFLGKIWQNQVFSYLGSPAVRAFTDPEGFPAFFSSTADLIRDNARLRQLLEQSRIQLLQCYQRLQEADRFSRLENFLAPYQAEGHYAQVVSQALYYCDQTVTISGGAHDGLLADDPIIGEGGLVGKILRCGPTRSEVQLLTNVGFAAAGYVKRSGTQGIVKGEGKPTLQLEYVRTYETVQPGDAVFTSGKDGLFPANFPVGVVTNVAKGTSGFLQITVVPYVNLSRVCHVLVYKRR